MPVQTSRVKRSGLARYKTQLIREISILMRFTQVWTSHKLRESIFIFTCDENLAY